MPYDFNVDFSGIAALPKIYNDARVQANRERTLSELGQGAGPLDYNNAARKLFAVGDTEGAMSLARLGQQQYVTSPEHAGAIAEAQAKVGEKYAPKTTNIKTAAGDEITVEKTSSGYRVPTIEGQPSSPNNPFAQGKMTEAQSKDALYTSRMLNAERVLREPGVVEAATSLPQRGLGKIPIAGNYLVSEGYQKFDQAQRDFINATLRRESGAVISEAEFANARKQYFPEPGDGAEKIKQKQTNRIEAIKGIGSGAGPGYRPAYSIDASGNIVDNPSAQKQQTAQQPAQQARAGLNPQTIKTARDNPQAAIAEAKAAIASGKDPNMVKKRLQLILGAGYDTGL